MAEPGAPTQGQNCSYDADESLSFLGPDPSSHARTWARTLVKESRDRWLLRAEDRTQTHGGCHAPKGCLDTGIWLGHGVKRQMLS